MIFLNTISFNLSKVFPYPCLYSSCLLKLLLSTSYCFADVVLGHHLCHLGTLEIEACLMEEGLLDASPFGTGTGTGTGGSGVNDSEDRREAQSRSRLMDEDFQGDIRPVKPEKSASENSKYG